MARTLFTEEKSVLSPSIDALQGRQMEVELPCSPVGESVNVSWWDLWGLDALCVLAGAWAAFVSPIKRLKQWMIAVGNCSCIQYKYRHCVRLCQCVITVRSSVVIIHDIQHPHKLHIQAQLQISGSKWVDVQYISALFLLKYCRQGRKRRKIWERDCLDARHWGPLFNGEWK